MVTIEIAGCNIGKSLCDPKGDRCFKDGRSSSKEGMKSDLISD